MAYVEASTIKSFAETPEESPDAIWNLLAASASLIFDRAAGVEENFFAKAGDNPSDKTFYGNDTPYLQIPPFVDDDDSLTVTLPDGYEVPRFDLKDGYLVLLRPSGNYSFYDINYVWSSNILVTVSARWGFAGVPADVQQAVIEQALFMYRRKDSAFTEISGVSTAVVQQQLSPTCQFVADKYKGIYLNIGV